MKVVILLICAVGLVLTQDVRPEFPEDLEKTSTIAMQERTTTITAQLTTPEPSTILDPEATTTSEFTEPTTTLPITTTQLHKSEYPTPSPPQCYFKTQQRGPHLRWFSCGLRWIYPIDCYYCCVNEIYKFAGCSIVSNAYCQHNNAIKKC